MRYPTLEEVQKATQLQLARWMRFLPSPGENHMHLENKEFQPKLDEEEEILKEIISRFEGWNPQLSKQVGWTP